MSTNPYAPPTAQVADETVVQDRKYVPGGHSVPAGHGWNWIAEGWTLFKNAPGMWIAITVMYVVILMLAFIPIVGGIALSLFMPVLGGGVMLGCRALDEGKELEFQHLFAGFRTQFGTLVAVGALYLVASIAIMFIAMIVTGASLFALFAGGGQDPAALAAAFTTMALAALVMLALFVPLMMALWFAPALVVFHGLGAVEAMKQSFTGCLRNIVPFLVYGVILIVPAFIATIPLGLGCFFFFDISFSEIYTAYRDVYLI
jgi:hypothetical protein